MSYLEFDLGNISPCNFTFGQAFHFLPISLLFLICMGDSTIAHASCKGLVLKWEGLKPSKSYGLE